MINLNDQQTEKSCQNTANEADDNHDEPLAPLLDEHLKFEWMEHGHVATDGAAQDCHVVALAERRTENDNERVRVDVNTSHAQEVRLPPHRHEQRNDVQHRQDELEDLVLSQILVSCVDVDGGDVERHSNCKDNQ